VSPGVCEPAAVVGAFFWGLLAAASLLVGAVVAWVHPMGRRVLGVTMAFGAGVLLSAVAFDLVLPAVDISAPGTLVGFLSGMVVFTVGDITIARLGYGDRKDIAAAPTEASGLTIALGALLDGVPETAVLGLTILQTGEIGVALLAAVFISNVPEAVAATSSLRAGGWSARRVFGLWSFIAVASALASALGYLFLDGASVHVLAFMYAFAGGAILTMLATSMIPEAYEEVRRAAGVATVLGGVVAFWISWTFG
jgi:ZIP family zinc transporter